MWVIDLSRIRISCDRHSSKKQMSRPSEMEKRDDGGLTDRCYGRGVQGLASRQIWLLIGPMRRVQMIAQTMPVTNSASVATTRPGTMIQPIAGMLSGAVTIPPSKPPAKMAPIDQNILAVLCIMARFAGVAVFALRRLISAHTTTLRMPIVKRILTRILIRNIHFLVTLVVKLPFGVQLHK